MQGTRGGVRESCEQERRARNPARSQVSPRFFSGRRQPSPGSYQQKKSRLMAT